ncbi:MAG: Fic family protein [Pseudobutyrivibrio ruminis]|uniref:Fic family protein n=1 Tax=Pseudobutyrivibrio ruminis TaxID=46206 RepID=A0A927U8E9_9FIRM|nr:Fic family protein [Pseudobutyrivibrio ruminis]
MIPNKYLEEMRRNLRLRSRTANGIVDTSASKGKEKIVLITSGDKASELAHKNFEDAINYAWDMRDAPLSSPEDIRKIIEHLGLIINRGIVKEENLIRVLDSDKYAYVKVAKMKEHMEWFYPKLFERLMQSPGDPVEEAAFTEFQIDIRGHYFADGCGKTSMVSAAWVLFRRNHPLMEYIGGRDAFYSHTYTGTTKTEDEVYEEFLEYYRSLFK